MNIKKVKTAKKVGKFILRTDNHRNLIGFEYEKNIKPILDNEVGRVYLFTSNGEMDNHAVGNLLLTALWDRDADPVKGLDRVGQLLKVVGRVLPMALRASGVGSG